MQKNNNSLKKYLNTKFLNSTSSTLKSIELQKKIGPLGPTLENFSVRVNKALDVMHSEEIRKKFDKILLERYTQKLRESRSSARWQLRLARFVFVQIIANISVFRNNWKTSRFSTPRWKLGFNLKARQKIEDSIITKNYREKMKKKFNLQYFEKFMLHFNVFKVTKFRLSFYKYAKRSIIFDPAIRLKKPIFKKIAKKKKKKKKLIKIGYEKNTLKKEFILDLKSKKKLKLENKLKRKNDLKQANKLKQEDKSEQENKLKSKKKLKSFNSAKINNGLSQVFESGVDKKVLKNNKKKTYEEKRESFVLGALRKRNEYLIPNRFKAFKYYYLHFRQQQWLASLFSFFNKNGKKKIAINYYLNIIIFLKKKYNKSSTFFIPIFFNQILFYVTPLMGYKTVIKKRKRYRYPYVAFSDNSIQRFRQNKALSIIWIKRAIFHPDRSELTIFLKLWSVLQITRINKGFACRLRRKYHFILCKKKTYIQLHWAGRWI